MAKIFLESSENRKQKILVQEEDGHFSGKVSHILFADGHKDVGGEESAPAPYDYLLTALAACTSMTLQLYAERKGMALEKVEIDLTHKKIDSEVDASKVDFILKHIRLHGKLSEEEVKRLKEIAEKCPVNKTLLGTIKMESHVERS